MVPISRIVWNQVELFWIFRPFAGTWLDNFGYVVCRDILWKYKYRSTHGPTLYSFCSRTAGEFLSGDFVQASYFESTKDRVIRGLRTYFESRRADSHAMYYRDALLASQDGGIEESLNIAMKAQLEDVQKHFETILSNKEISLECLFSGNVSEHDAATFYNAVSSTIQKAQEINSHHIPSSAKALIPGKFKKQKHAFVDRIITH